MPNQTPSTSLIGSLQMPPISPAMCQPLAYQRPSWNPMMRARSPAAAYRRSCSRSQIDSSGAACAAAGAIVAARTAPAAIARLRPKAVPSLKRLRHLRGRITRVMPGSNPSDAPAASPTDHRRRRRPRGRVVGRGLVRHERPAGGGGGDPADGSSPPPPSSAGVRARTRAPSPRRGRARSVSCWRARSSSSRSIRSSCASSPASSARSRAATMRWCSGCWTAASRSTSTPTRGSPPPAGSTASCCATSSSTTRGSS